MTPVPPVKVAVSCTVAPKAMLGWLAVKDWMTAVDVGPASGLVSFPPSLPPVNDPPPHAAATAVKRMMGFRIFISIDRKQMIAARASRVQFCGMNLAPGTRIETDLPGRLDRLPWSRWHWRVVIALGVTWVLDGLEVTLVGSVASVLGETDTLHLSEREIGAAASAYLFGAILGALIFGRLTDKLGRKKLFLVTLGVYLTATLLTALSFNFWSFALFRALTGAGIGGEYAAINSAIDELIPARVRGRVDLMINGSYWIGAALGSAATIVLLDPRRLPVWLGWRLAFGIGATLGLIVIFFRRWIPESPRWLMIHGRNAEAEKIVDEVERTIAPALLPPHDEPAIRIRTRTHTPWHEIWHTIVHEHRRRSLLGFVLMLTQAFFYSE